MKGASNYNPCISVLTSNFQFVFFYDFTFVPFLVSHFLTSCGQEKLRQMMKGEPSISTLRDWSEKRGWGALRRKNLSSISTPLPRKFLCVWNFRRLCPSCDKRKILHKRLQSRSFSRLSLFVQLQDSSHFECLIFCNKSN